MSTPSNPLEFVARYLQAVRFWLPKTQGQEDVLSELGEDLRSQIEQQETELGRALDKDEVSAILKRCGAPMLVASRLSPSRYLIGPTLFPVYKFVMKIVLLWILLPLFMFIVGPTSVAINGGDWGAGVLNTMGHLWFGWFMAAGIITLVFAILERTHSQMVMDGKWDPMKLPPVPKEECKSSLVGTAFQLVFAVFGLAWLLLMPHYPVLIFGPAAALLKAAPMWHKFYLPILLVGVVALLRPSITLAKPEWVWFPSFGELVQTGLSLILLNFIIDTAGRTDGGEWHPFVMLTDAASNSAQYAHVAALVNVSILLSLIGVWFGLCIAIVIQAWRFVRAIRKRSPASRQPVALEVH